MAKMVKQALRVYRDFRVLWGHPVIRVCPESLVKRECQDLLANRDQEETQAKTDWTVLQESKADRVPLVIEDHQEHLVQEDSRVCRVLLERQDNLAKMEMQASPGPPVCQATKESKVQEDFQDKGVPLVPQGQQE